MLLSKTFVPVFLSITLFISFFQETIAQKETLIINSNGFNAKKRSSFNIGGIEEKVERGLTLIHFNSSKKHEFKGFDTYGSEEALDELVTHIQKMLAQKTTFAILAHDSAVKGSLSKSKELIQMGLVQLSSLKSRQAYVMYAINGQLKEVVDDLSVEESISIPDNISDNQIYFPRITYEFEPSNDRYIAHAAGEVNGIKSTNSKEALDENYKKGFRLFELDIIKTSDGKLVAAHDWKMWSRFTDYGGSLPPSHSEFMKHKIYGDYTTLDMTGINQWFATHPDAILITDKLNDPVAFAEAFVDKSRLIMELFSMMSMDEASREGINIMISQDPLFALKGDKMNYLKVNNIKYAAVSRRIIRNQTKLLLELKKNDIKVYVYNVNFDPGKDEKYVQENEIGLVYGMYADKWVFD
ncbi:interleukin-like EMT inducer domain-containing protein [Croceitalea rosinachiae]|uniref:ILEI/PANDER domain-containing protein n=1 Tax=Croceitalea rosinachiae TaxID=3075596 RepID=A0ABU3ABJ5_9FLAO|nr:interleukin-like EMT inducer domain-containing protein [Croceitalea sp. F388]MDT0607538.1 hypothetical protein [Croceitalea sp. F388]